MEYPRDRLSPTKKLFQNKSCERTCELHSIGWHPLVCIFGITETQRYLKKTTCQTVLGDSICMFPILFYHGKSKVQSFKYCFKFVVKSATFQELFALLSVRGVFLVLQELPARLHAGVQVSGPCGEKSKQTKTIVSFQRKKMAKIKLRAFLPQQHKFAWLPGVAATGGTRRAHHFMHIKEMLLLADSNYITWARSIPCVKIGSFALSSFRNRRVSEFSLAESWCADTGTNDTGILQRSVRGVEPLCFATSHKALFHMKQRASPTAAKLAVVWTLLGGSADRGCPHHANIRGILPSQMEERGRR